MWPFTLARVEASMSYRCAIINDVVYGNYLYPMWPMHVFYISPYISQYVFALNTIGVAHTKITLAANSAITETKCALIELGDDFYFARITGADTRKSATAFVASPNDATTNMTYQAVGELDITGNALACTN